MAVSKAVKAVSNVVMAVSKAVAIAVAVETVAVSQTVAKWHLRHVQIVYISLLTDHKYSGGKRNVKVAGASLLINVQQFMAAAGRRGMWWCCATL